MGIMELGPEGMNYGTDLIADTGAETGKWYKFRVITEATFTLLTDGARTLHGALPVFPALFEYHGAITAITLTSGSILAYRARPA
jgi:hypothetical protein